MMVVPAIITLHVGVTVAPTVVITELDLDTDFSRRRLQILGLVLGGDGRTVVPGARLVGDGARLGADGEVEDQVDMAELADVR